MVVLKYNKILDEILKDEALAIVKEYDSEFTFAASAKKETILMKIDSISQIHNFAWDADSLFYFTADNITKEVKCFKNHQIVRTEFAQSRPRKWNDFKELDDNSDHNSEHSSEHSSITDIKSLIESQTVLTQTNVERFNQIANLVELQSKKQSSVSHKMKVEYDESLGLRHFFAQMDCWCSVHQETDDATIIRKANSVLVQSPTGLGIREALKFNMPVTWSEFKRQLNEIMGQDSSFYRKRFRSIKKEVGQTFGYFLSQLSIDYKYAYDKNILNADDKSHILHQFIENCNSVIKSHLENEYSKSELTFENCAQRATQLSRCYKHEPENNFLCSIQSHDPPMPERSEKSKLQQMVEENARLIKELLARKNDRIQSRPQSRSQLTPAIIDKMKTQVCFAFSQTGSCKFGERCYRKHSSLN